MATMAANAFAVPPRLRARKRKPTSRSTDQQEQSLPSAFSFFTEDEYAQFSINGDAYLSTLYLQEELQRQTLIAEFIKKRQKKMATAINSKNRSGVSGSRAVMDDSGGPQKHLTRILMEKKQQVQTTEKIQAENAFRRISALRIPQHEAYLSLLRKRIDGQRRGLPGLLALTSEETTQLRALEGLVQEEQQAFYQTFELIMRTETAKHNTIVPTFVDECYEQWKTQSRNDVYRLYPRYFEPALEISLQTFQFDNEVSILKHIKEVFTFGVCPVIDESVLVDGQVMDSFNDSKSDWGIYMARDAISADHHAEALMEKHDCDVAMSSSTLLALFDNDTKTFAAPQGWIIPVKSRSTVKPGLVTQAKKRVFFDQCLPADATSTREKIARAGRTVLLPQLVRESAALAPPGPSENPICRERRRTYHVWELSGKKILVRCAIDAYLQTSVTTNEQAVKVASTQTSVSPTSPDYKSENTDSDFHKRRTPMSLFVKPDYKDLGLPEQITVSEKQRFWLHSWLRGSATIVVGRLNPVTNTIESWEQRSLSSHVYGHNSQVVPEWFQPMEKFRLVDEVLSEVCSLPVGNYLVKSSPSEPNKVEVLMATSESTNASSTMLDLYKHMNEVEEHAATERFILPAWPTYHNNRIPYTFRTGSYCEDFYREGVCPRIAAGQLCEGVHLRQLYASTSCWIFEDYTKILKQKKGIRAARPIRLHPRFPFCQDAKPIDVSDPHAQVICNKANQKGKTCALPHLTVHQVAERLADQTICEERLKRQKQKRSNKEKHQHFR